MVRLGKLCFAFSHIPTDKTSVPLHELLQATIENTLQTYPVEWRDYTVARISRLFSEPFTLVVDDPISESRVTLSDGNEVNCEHYTRYYQRFQFLFYMSQIYSPRTADQDEELVLPHEILHAYITDGDSFGVFPFQRKVL